jgi:hypothetical protein
LRWRWQLIVFLHGHQVLSVDFATLADLARTPCRRAPGHPAAQITERWIFRGSPV